MFTLDVIRVALEAESEPWRCIDILYERLILGENTVDLARDCQPYRQLYIEKLIAMPNDGELHLLVQRGQTIFHYQSREIEREVREARPVEQAVIDDVDPWPSPVSGAAVLNEV